MKGFTLLELLIVIGIVVILIGITIAAINPARQIAQANNSTRWSGVQAISSAVAQRIIDNGGSFAYDEPDFPVSNCPADGDDIPTSTTIMGSDIGQYDICTALVPPPANYLAALPVDPQTGNYTDCTAFNTRYDIVCDPTTGRITICAPDAQLGETICFTR